MALSLYPHNLHLVRLLLHALMLVLVLLMLRFLPLIMAGPDTLSSLV